MLNTTNVLRAVMVSMMWATASTSLILLNKHILSDLDYPYPLFLGCTGMAFSSFAAWCCVHVLKTHKLERVSRETYLKRFLPVGFFMAGTLGFGNVVYLYLSVTFIQMLKALTPVMILLVVVLARLERPSKSVIAAVLIISAGTGVTSHGEVSFRLSGFLIMMLSEACEACKLAAVQYLLSDRKFGLIEGIYRLTPLAVGWLLLFIVPLELRAMVDAGAFAVMLRNPLKFAAAASMGFVVNLLTLAVIQATSSLTFKIIGQAKNVLVILCGVLLMENVVTAEQALGYTVAVFGFCLYHRARHLQAGQTQAAQVHEKGGILPTTTTTAAAAAAAAAGHSAAQARHHRGLGLGLGREGTELTYVGGGSAVAADGLEGGAAGSLGGGGGGGAALSRQRSTGDRAAPTGVHSRSLSHHQASAGGAGRGGEAIPAASTGHFRDLRVDVGDGDSRRAALARQASSSQGGVGPLSLGGGGGGGGEEAVTPGGSGRAEGRIRRLSAGLPAASAGTAAATHQSQHQQRPNPGGGGGSGSGLSEPGGGGGAGWAALPRAAPPPPPPPQTDESSAGASSRGVSGGATPSAPHSQEKNSATAGLAAFGAAAEAAAAGGKKAAAAAAGVVQGGGGGGGGGGVGSDVAAAAF